MFPASTKSANLKSPEPSTNQDSHKRSFDDLYGDLDIQAGAHLCTVTHSDESSGTDDIGDLINKGKEIFTEFGSLFETAEKKYVTELAHVRMEREFGFEYLKEKAEKDREQLKQEKEKTEEVLERITKEKNDLESNKDTVNEEFIQKMDDVKQELHQVRLEKQSIAFENGEIKNEIGKIQEEFDKLSNAYIVLNEEKQELETKLMTIEDIVSGHMYD